jgi:hypothetical protein
MATSPDQQPILRTVGKRQARDGRVMTTADREAMSAMARYRTRAPKGVFRYDNHEQMAADRLRWQIDAVVAQQTNSK